MLAKNITVSLAELNTHSVNVKSLGAEKTIESSGTLYLQSHLRQYKPTTLKVTNVSGSRVNYLPITTEEYNQYLITGSALTDLLTIENGVSDTINGLKGTVTYLLAQGVAAHTSGCIFNFIEETV